jgi:hypothetical protein
MDVALTGKDIGSQKHTIEFLDCVLSGYFRVPFASLRAGFPCFRGEKASVSVSAGSHRTVNPPRRHRVLDVDQA